jgi:hypothetical protein
MSCQVLTARRNTFARRPPPAKRQTPNAKRNRPIYIRERIAKLMAFRFSFWNRREIPILRTESLKI